MREVKLETLVITKEAWKFLRKYSCTSRGFKEPTDEQLEKTWNRMDFKNGGAYSKTYPIAENEIRIESDSFAIRWEKVKELLAENGFGFRSDGFIQEAMYI